MITLYDSPGSPCARRVRITLIEKGLAYDTIFVDLSRLEQKSPAYLRLNPNGVVPTLVHGERAIYESNVITEYLDDVFPDVALYPDDPWERAQVKHWQAVELALAKDFRPLLYQRLMGPIVRLTRPTLEEALAVARRSTSNPFDLAWERKVWSLAVLTPDEESALVARLYARIDLLERALDGHEFLVGDRFGQADISVFPRVRMYPFVQLPIAAERYPNTARWMARLEARPSFAKSLFGPDLALQRLARTGIVPWIAGRLRRAPETWSLSERLRLGLLRRMLSRPPSGPRAARAARNGVEPPAAANPVRPVRPPAAPREPLVLYDSPLSPTCRRVRILLRALGIPHRTVPVDLVRMEHKRPEFLALNPSGEVPVLCHGDRVLADSALISEYLAETFDGTRFLPADAFERAQVRMWIAFDQALHKEWRPLLHHVVGGPLLPADDARLLRVELLRRAGRIEEALADRNVLVGTDITLADVAWFSRLEAFPTLGMPLDALPGISRWLRMLRDRPAFAEPSLEEATQARET